MSISYGGPSGIAADFRAAILLSPPIAKRPTESAPAGAARAQTGSRPAFAESSLGGVSDPTERCGDCGRA